MDSAKLSWWLLSHLLSEAAGLSGQGLRSGAASSVSRCARQGADDSKRSIPIWLESPRAWKMNCGAL